MHDRHYVVRIPIHDQSDAVGALQQRCRAAIPSHLAMFSFAYQQASATLTRV
jgi:hypothetical protein